MTETQNKKIRAHLLSGKSITPIEALNLYGCFRLAARIRNLKDQGVDIDKIMVDVGRKKVAMYFVPEVFLKRWNVG